MITRRRPGWVMLGTLFLLSVAGVVGAVPAKQPRTPEQVAQTITMLGHMLEGSSVTRQVEQSGNAEAKTALHYAQVLYDGARQAVEHDQHAKASEMLDEALKQVMMAGRMSRDTDGSSAQSRQQFEARLRSVDALLRAHERISIDKGVEQERAAVGRMAEAELKQARRLAEEGRYGDGMAALDRAYTLVTSSVGEMRSGDTLVRSLNFASAEDEYHYELDRNNTYQMLITMLVEERHTMTITPRVQGFLDEANALRRLAESQADGGDYAAGIKSLERATQNLIFALRNAGFFIPG